MTQTTGRILVTGANGCLGGLLIRRLGGTRIRALVRSERAATSLRALPAESRPEIVVVDYADAASLGHAAEGCQAAVHLVGILKETSNTRYTEAHEMTCRALARAAARAKLRRIVYLSIVGASPRSTNSCLASKGRAEEILLAAETDATILRVPMVLAPGAAAVAALRREATSRFLPLIRGGQSLEQPMDGHDVIDAIVRALDDPSLAGESLDLGGPECLSHRRLVARIARRFGREPRIVPIPMGVVRTIARALERFSSDPPITFAMLEVLDQDDCVDTEGVCRRLGLRLRSLDETLDRCLDGAGAGS